MIRLIIAAPEALAIGELTEEQQIAIKSVFAQFAMPMPGTKTLSGYKLIDAVVADNFNPDSIAALGLPFTLLGQWQWDGRDSFSETQTLDSSFINYLPDTYTYDETGAILTTTAPELHEPHTWAGWPYAF